MRRFEGEELRHGDEDQNTALILAAMFGETTSAQGDFGRELPSARETSQPATKELLSITHVSTAAAHEGTPLKAVTLKIHAGEIVGVAGIDGHGQRHLAEVIAGQRKPTS